MTGAITPRQTVDAKNAAAHGTSDDAPAALDGPEFRPYDRYFEDFALGTHLTTRGMTVTESHIVMWANLAGDWLPLHVDQDVSSRSVFGSIIGHGPLSLALSLGLVIQTGFFGDAVIAWLGLDDVRATSPVLPGDTIHVVAQVVEQEPTRKPERGRVTLSYDVRNQRGDTVMTFTSGFLMRVRGAAVDAASNGTT
jgi:acyl dehydratase